VAGDLEAVAEIQGDPATNAFNPSGPTGVDEAGAMLDGWIADWDRDGIGYWMVCSVCGGPVIGVAGVRRGHSDEGDRDAFNLYYRFRPEGWGNGFAREVGAAAIETVAAGGGPATVVAVVHEDNEPSIRVAVALGMTPDGTTEHKGGERLRFVLRIR
jgi:[ribosomal protein S5]-alanine N-acetyltransferase